MIKPITFVEDKIIEDENLNEIFITPYNCKNYFDNGIMQIYNTVSSELDCRDVDGIRNTIVSQDISVREKIINDYIYMNIKDIFMYKLLTFSAKYFPSCNITYPEFSIPVFGTRSDLLFRNNKCDVDTFGYFTSVSLFNYMNNVLSVLTRYYNDWLFNILMHNNLDNSFEIAYKLAYDGEIDSDCVDYNTKYTTVTTIFREIMNNDLLDIRKAMIKISDNVYNMILDGYKFAYTINYNTPVSIEDTKVVKNINLIQIKEDFNND